MKVSDFTFELPPALIAQFPPENRTDSRLLVLDSDLSHRSFPSIIDKLEEGDLLVLNNSRVLPARLLCSKLSGGQVEVFVERLEGSHGAVALVRSSKPVIAGMLLRVNDTDVFLEVIGRQGMMVRVESKSMGMLALLHIAGKMPIPPYMRREAEVIDTERYQTVYSEPLGSLAAPTAGLHFDESTFEKIKAKGVKIAFVTLHVGAGTFLPLREEQVRTQQLHEELIEVSEETARLVNETKAQGGRVIAVGTTTVRTLESAARRSPTGNKAQLSAFKGGTTLFLQPGDAFYVVDAMLTNFHLPESSLLMLVCAFGGKDRVLNAYRAAIEEQYRFYSYGDCMWIDKHLDAPEPV